MIRADSNTQKAVSLSSAEAELVALSDLCKHIIWIRSVLDELGITQDGPSTIYQDNKSTISMALKGPSNGHRSRHINIRFFFVKEHIDSQQIKLVHIAGLRMLADILTKAEANGVTFDKMVQAMRDVSRSLV
jgi:hypothetical protein